jgi:hypothetical protein
LIAIGIFSQKKHRTNSCSIYLVAVSVFGLISANRAIAPIVYALDHFNMVNSSLVLCRIRGYIIHSNSMCFRYTIILMCANRYALCNARVSVRALCRPQIAYRSIYIFCTFTYPLMLIYTNITNNMIRNKTAERKEIESFINFITMSLLLYLNYNTTFYVPILTAKTYRTEVKQWILKLIGKSREIEQN